MSLSIQGIKTILTLFLCLLVFIQSIFSQDIKEKKERNWAINGYIKDLQNTWIQDFEEEWVSWNTIHNRLDFKWYPCKSLSVDISMRNQIQYGQLISSINSIDLKFSDQFKNDPGFFDLSTVISEEKSYILFSNFDRAFINYSKEKWDIKIGRQRVNWGIGLVWNPNDIFNTYSYFDFDYEERPGADAISVQYYHNYTSSTQLVYKVNSEEEISAAGIYRFNKWDYDIQFLGGMMEDDFVFGGGWAGQIEGGGFRGEVTYFIDKENFQDTSGVLIATIEGDYSFKKGFYLHGALLFNSEGTSGNAGWGSLFINQNITAKTITLSKFSIFGQVMYPITPIINANIASIYNPNDESIFVAPSVDISLKEDVNLLLMSQMFIGDPETEFGDYGKIIYIRLKFCF